jgi:hypothetical protein
VRRPAAHGPGNEDLRDDSGKINPGSVSAGATVGPQVPVRSGGMYLLRRPTLDSPQFHSASSSSTVRPANSAVRSARRRGLLITATNHLLASAAATAVACRSPSAVNGRSVTDVCRCALLHSVSP